MKTIEDWVLTPDKEARMEDYAFAEPFAPRSPGPGHPGPPGDQEQGDTSDQDPAGLGFVPVSLGTPGNPMTRQESPHLHEWTMAPREAPMDAAREEAVMQEAIEAGGELENEAMAMLDDWNFVDNDKEARMEDYAFMVPVQMGLPPGMKMPGVKTPGKDEPPPEPPPPAEVRRMMTERMRDMGRQLMISGAKQPRQQMIEIGKVMNGLMDQLDALSDQPGRKALQRRMLLQLRPRVMNPKR